MLGFQRVAGGTGGKDRGNGDFEARRPAGFLEISEIPAARVCIFFPRFPLDSRLERLYIRCATRGGGLLPLPGSPGPRCLPLPPPGPATSAPGQAAAQALPGAPFWSPLMQKTARVSGPSNVTADGQPLSSQTVQAFVARFSRAQVSAILAASEHERVICGTLPMRVTVLGCTLPVPDIAPHCLADIAVAGLNTLAKQRVSTAAAKIEADLTPALVRNGLGFPDLFPTGSRAYGKLVASALRKVATGIETPYTNGTLTASDLDTCHASDVAEQPGDSSPAPR